MGVSIAEIQNMLLQEGVDCRDALNLDGGGSAQFFLDSHLPGALPELQEVTIHGRDDVPVALGLFIN